MRATRSCRRAEMLLVGLAAGFLCLGGPGGAGVSEFRSAWPAGVTRTWIGPEYWTSRLQDWRIADGRLECTTGGPNRNVHILTRELTPGPGDLRLSVRLGNLAEGRPSVGWAGFRVGAKGRLFGIAELEDYRDNALRGEGLHAGITTAGEVFIGRPRGGAASGAVGIPREGWKAHSVSSEHSAAEGAANAMDGDPGTFWHAKYGSEGGAYPHEIALDLGKSQAVAGIAYVGRQEQSVGRIRAFEVYTSQDGQEWGEPAARGEFRDTAELQRVNFAERPARYVRLVAKSGVTDRPACAIAELYVLDGTAAATPAAAPPPRPTADLTDVTLRLTASPEGEGYRVTLTAVDAAGRALDEAAQRVPAADLVGGLALVCDASAPRGAGAGRAAPGRPAGVQAAGGNVRFWFRDWVVGGSKVRAHDERAFGPILWSQYTLSLGVLKMTAQMPPIGEKDAQEVRLQVRQGEAWKEIARAPIDADARTATFRVPEWDDRRDTPYRLAYALLLADGATRDSYREGTVRRDPVEKGTLVVVAFTGNSDPAFPNRDVVKHVRAHDPDLLFFSGDQIYENVGGYGTERAPVERATLDYLRKWYVYGWSFGELMRDRPCVSLPDDHDVYQGNLWGAGGRAAPVDNQGGYVMPARWVNMVQRTQTSHLPDPYDPAPVEQGIGVYYCGFTYGRVSFAVLEDRKFKSGPAGRVPPTSSGRPDWESDPNFDYKAADAPGAQLLGDRQLRFLADWTADWRGAEMKATLSQTIFAGAATHHGGMPGQHLAADYDSNGWPQSGRNRALEEIRRGFAFMIGGDQHLATLIHHGVADWDDAGWSFAVPSIANFYVRSWLPQKPPVKAFPGMPAYTGQFLDGFGNHISVWAAANPSAGAARAPEWLHGRNPGYGIVRFDKRARRITAECWPRYADPRDPKSGKQYEGWPKTISQLDNYGPKPAAWLPELRVSGMADPVVQVVDEADGQVVYTLRIRGTRFRPMLFREGSYTVKVGEPPERVKTLKGVRSLPAGRADTLEVKL